MKFPIIDPRTPRIGLGLAMFTLPGVSDAKVVEEFEAHYARWAEHLRWWSDNDRERWRQVAPELIELPRRRLLSPRSKKRAFVAYAHGAIREDDPHPNFLSIEADPYDAQEDTIGILRMWHETLVTPQGLLDEALSACKRVQPLQGCGGWMMCPYVDHERSQFSRELQFAVAQRHLGVEVEHRSFPENAKRHRLRSVQWLTIVADSLLEPLGGRAVLATLPEAVRVHDYGAGVLIQAGDAPGLGDVNAGETLPLYRAVARLLAPIRNREPLPFNIEEPDSLGCEETKKWYRRFDADA